MLTKVKIGALSAAVAQASHTLDSRAASIGSYLHLIARGPKGDQEGRLYVYSSNLGMARTLLKLPAEVTKDGIALIPPKLLQAIIGTLPAGDDIELGLSPSGAKLQVKYESIKSEIAVHADSQKNTEVLSTIPFNAKPNTSVSSEALVDIINRTLFCTATGANAATEGPWLSSVLLEVGDSAVVGTATNKIIAGKAFVHDGLVTSKMSVGIHREALVALKTILSKRKDNEEVTITSVNSSEGVSNEILFRFSDTILGVRQLAKAYPAVVAKIFTVPNNYKLATLNRGVLLASLGRLGSFAEKGSFTVSFAGSKATLVTKGYSSTFQEQIAKQEESEGTVTIGLGISDVVSVLTVMKSEDVVLRYINDEAHVHFQEGDSEFRYVLSPVQITWGAKGKAA